MSDPETLEPVLKYGVLALAAGAGYFVITKILDKLIPPKDHDGGPVSHLEPVAPDEDVDAMRRRKNEENQTRDG